MRVAATLVLLAALVAGCGDDDSSDEPQTAATVDQPATTDSGPSALTKADYIMQTDAICEAANRKVDEINATDDSTAARVKASLPILQEAQDEFERLEPPPELRIQVDQFLAAFEDQQRLIREVARLEAVGEAAEADQLFAEFERARDRKSEIALAAGFAECGSQ
jgi:hypothetical protein